MGLAKRELERLQELDDAALQIAAKVGAITIDHETDEATYNADDEADKHAYALGMTLQKAGKLDGSPKEVAAAIKQALDDAAY